MYLLLFQNNGSKVDTLSSLPQASFNYINSIVGSGVIGIPYAFHRAGFGLGLLLLVVVAFITDYSLILMVSSVFLCYSFVVQIVQLERTTNYIECLIMYLKRRRKDNEKTKNEMEKTPENTEQCDMVWYDQLALVPAGIWNIHISR